MGGITSSSAKKREAEREAELQKMIAARLAIFNKPPEPEDSDEEEEGSNNSDREVKQMSLTVNNVKVNSRKISAPTDTKESAPPSGKIDGPSHILDDRMVKVLEFMLDPEFNKGELTLRTLLTTTEKKSSKAFSEAVQGISGILVVVESMKGHVFGAYIDDKFELASGGWRRGSDDNFLFALGNVSKQPMKLLANPERKYSYFSDSTTGFYAGQGQFDISAFSARYVCMEPVVYTIMAPSYNERNEIEFKDGMLCGTPGVANYEPKRMEVFAVTHFEDPDDPATKKKIKERAKLEEQKLIDKEKRAKQRRLERKMRKEQKKKALARIEAARLAEKDKAGNEAIVPPNSTPHDS